MQNKKADKTKIFSEQFQVWRDAHRNDFPTHEILAKHFGIGNSTLDDYLRGKSFPGSSDTKRIYELTGIELLKPKA